MNVFRSIGGNVRIFPGLKWGSALRGHLTLHEQIQGEIVEARQAGQYLVRVRGMPILAQSSLQLLPGRTYLFETAHLEPQVELKLVVPDLSNAAAKAQFLKSFGLPVEPIYMNALEIIILSGSIPTKEDLSALAALFQNNKALFEAEYSSRDILQALFMLEKFKLPINAKTMSAAIAFLQGKIQVAEALGNLQELIRQIISDKDTGKKFDEKIQILLTTINGHISRFFSFQSTGQTSSSLHQLISILGILYEKNLKSQVTGDIQSDRYSEIGSLKGLILQLMDYLSTSSSSAENAQPVNLSAQLQAVMDQIEHAQILHNNKNSIGDWTVSYVPVPFLIDGKPQTVDLLFQRRGKTTQKPDYWKVHLSMQLERAGLTHIFMSGFKTMFSLHVLSQNESFSKLLQEEGKDLPKLLQPLGYMLQKFSVAYVEDVNRERNAMLLREIFEKPKPVDIKV